MAAVEDSVPLVAFDTGVLLLRTGAIVTEATRQSSALHSTSENSAHSTPRSLYASPDPQPRSRSRQKRSQHNLYFNRDENVPAIKGECVRILDNHSDAVSCCDWSRSEDGKRFVLSGSGDETLRVWDLDSGLRSNCTRVLKGHSGAVWCCQFSRGDGGRRWALSGSRDKTLRIFDVETGDCTSVLQGHQGSVQACSWSVGDAAGSRIVSASTDKSLKIWDRKPTGWTCTSTLLGHREAVMCAAWSEADEGCRWILSGSDDTTVRIWDTRSATSERTLCGHTGPVLCCAFSVANGGRRWALSGSWDKTVNLWDCSALLVQNEVTNTNSSLVLKLLGHSAPVFCCNFSEADGGNCWALTGAYDQTLRIWALSSGSCMTILEGHTRWVKSCCWSNADGGKRWVLSGSRDKTLRVWEVQWGDEIDADKTNEEQVILKEEVSIARAAKSPPTFPVTNDSHVQDSELLQHGALIQDHQNGIKHVAQRLATAEEEIISMRQLLRAKHAEVESCKMRRDEMEAEVDALVRSLGMSKQKASEQQQRIVDLEMQLMATHNEAQEEVVLLKEENNRQRLKMQEFARGQEAELVRVQEVAKAEADLAVKHAMGEVAKVSASNDRLAAELGDLEEARESCRQAQAEAARRMEEVVQREIAVKAREEALKNAFRKAFQGEAEGGGGGEPDAGSQTERDAERMRKDAWEAAKELADRMSEATECTKIPMPEGPLTTTSAVASSPRTSPHDQLYGSHFTGAIKPSPSPMSQRIGSVLQAKFSQSHTFTPSRDSSPEPSISSTIPSISPSSSTRGLQDRSVPSPESLTAEGEEVAIVPPGWGGRHDWGAEDARQTMLVAMRLESKKGEASGEETGYTQVAASDSEEQESTVAYGSRPALQMSRRPRGEASFVAQQRSLETSSAIGSVPTTQELSQNKWRFI